MLIVGFMTLVLCAVGTNAWLLNKPHLARRATRRWALGGKSHRAWFVKPTSKFTMEEPESISNEMLKLSWTIKSWKTHDPSPTEIFEVAYQLDDCADVMSAWESESTSWQSQIQTLRFQLNVEIKRRERLEKQVGDLRRDFERDISVRKTKCQESAIRLTELEIRLTESEIRLTESEIRLTESEIRLTESENHLKEPEILLNLSALCDMFIYYTAGPAVIGAGFSSYDKFVLTYAEKNALVLDGEMTEHDFNLWLQPVHDALGDIDIAQLIRVCPARHAIAPVEIRAKVSQKTFLLFCQRFDFGSHAAFASRLIEHLGTVPLTRMT
jgi:hypothetical protein